MKATKPTRFEKLAHLEAAMGLCKNFRVAIDVGAHIGLWSRDMAKRFDLVMAFEPWQPNQEAWAMTMRNYGNAVLHKVAIADRSYRARMEGEGHSKHYIVEDPAGNVQVKTLDSYGFTNVDLIKTDCEGADTLALKGARDTILRCKPVLIVESHPRYDRRFGFEPGAPMRFLESLGAKQVANMWCDYLFVWD